MDDIRLKYYSPVVVGTPGAELQTIKRKQQPADQNEPSFREVFQQQLNQNSGVNFSKHAVKRVMDHNIEISQESLDKLQEGVRMANEKKLGDTLILVDKTAFVVNAQNNTVITAMNNDEVKGNVFTNINGTVIL